MTPLSLQILLLTNRKRLSTMQIARMLDISEATVYNELARERGELMPVRLVQDD